MTRVALVTGAARGIGAATVARLAADGWAVVALDRCADDARLPYRLARRDELEAVVEAARSSGAEAASVVADANDPAGIERALELARTRFGGLDAAIAVAGVIAGGVPLWEMAPEEESAVIETDLHAVLSLARLAIPVLLERPTPRAGRFLAVASAAAVRGLPMLAAYCAAKAGVVAAVRCLALELAGTGITANAISPGSTATAILEQSARLYGLDSTAAFAAQQPLQRLVEPSEVASVLAYVASEEASAITGANIAADGGMSV